jgi:hypothetical protein
MSGMGVLLDDYAWMSDEQNARRVHDFLTGNEEPRMPPGGPYWSEENLTLLSDWITGGCKP